MKTGIPHRDRREALRRLCVQATELLEDMHEPVTRGQAANAPARRYRAIARGLIQVARDLAAIGVKIESNLESEPLEDLVHRKSRIRHGVRHTRKP